MWDAFMANFCVVIGEQKVLHALAQEVAGVFEAADLAALDVPWIE